MEDSQRAEVDSLIDQLILLGQGQRQLLDPRLLGNYEVAYTSTRRAPSERSSPSGGRFRGKVGRALFQTAGLYQSVITGEDGKFYATNKVAFKLFGRLPGFVGLRGVVQPVEDGKDDTCDVFFDPPVLSVADNLHLRIGETHASAHPPVEACSGGPRRALVRMPSLALHLRGLSKRLLPFPPDLSAFPRPE